MQFRNKMDFKIKWKALFCTQPGSDRQIYLYCLFTCLMFIVCGQVYLLFIFYWAIGEIAKKNVDCKKRFIKRRP